MKLAPTYLSRNRHGTFYFRMVIPASLRPLVNGKREFRRSLRTDSERLVLKRAQQHAVRFDPSSDRPSRMTEQNDYELDVLRRPVSPYRCAAATSVLAKPRMTGITSVANR